MTLWVTVATQTTSTSTQYAISYATSRSRGPRLAAACRFTSPGTITLSVW
jgi:hypothetical protein